MEKYIEEIRLNDFYKHLDEYVNSEYFQVIDDEGLLADTLATEFNFYDRCIMLDKDNMGEGDPAYTLMYCAVKYVMENGLRKDRLLDDIIFATADYYKYILDPENNCMLDIMTESLYVRMDNGGEYIKTLLLHFIDNPKWKARLGDVVN
jgi:hypothetical protein